MKITVSFTFETQEELSLSDIVNDVNKAIHGIEISTDGGIVGVDHVSNVEFTAPWNIAKPHHGRVVED